MILGLYKALITFTFPLIKATYIKKRLRIGKESYGRFNERIGNYKHPRPEGKLYWFHGASVGESISMLPLIDKLLSEDENLHILVTTGTLTSADIMQKRLPERAFHQFIPFDVPQYARNLINHFKPDLALWFESELWPSLLSEIKSHNIPLILVNGRISDKSYKTWKHFKFISKELLSCFNLCLGQSEQDKNRLTLLGAPKTACVGNLKFAGVPLPLDTDKLQTVKQSIGNRPVFLISSTHHNEEEQFASHLPTLQANVPNILTIVVPRHPQRGIEINQMFINKRFKTALRSANEPITPETEIYIADTIGEMGIWYNISPLTFIGGSLIPHGGQNFIEPARDKNAVIVGPYMHNFTEMLKNAKIAHAVWQVNSAAEVIEHAVVLYREPEELAEAQKTAYQWAESEFSVLDKIVTVLKKELHG